MKYQDYSSSASSSSFYSSYFLPIWRLQEEYERKEEKESVIVVEKK